ncbi:MAG: hypothetical protein JST80_08705 [Bdellovibrionales bacterium]|nr:hypothetical protein [Bdellovibrionales bacterium]
MKKIDVFKEFTAEERMTRVGGEKLRLMILKIHPVALEFAGRPIASVSFLDEGIAKLILEGWTAKDVEARLKFDRIHPRDLQIVRDLIKERSKSKT